MVLHTVPSTIIRESIIFVCFLVLLVSIILAGEMLFFAGDTKKNGTVLSDGEGGDEQTKTNTTRALTKKSKN